MPEENILRHEEWPAYRIGNRDYIHALGVISAVFNNLEFRLRSLFPMYVRRPLPVAYALFANSNNKRRLGLMREGINYSRHPDTIKDDVRYFLDCYKKCTDNRNVLMHSTVFFIFGPGDISCPQLAPPGHQPEGVGFQKFAKDDPFRINTYQLNIAELRKHADDLKALEVYGDRLYWHILKHYEPTWYQAWGFPEEAQHALPNRPAPPNLLVPIPPDPMPQNK